MRSAQCACLAGIFFAMLSTPACRKEPVRSTEVVVAPAAKLPVDPDDPAWEKAPEYVAKLVLQDLVEPRLMTPSTGEVRVRALANASDAAFRLQWLDPNRSDLPGPGKFSDACALQIPGKLEPKPPAPQMGEKGRTVEVTYWRADWQASVDGRGETIRDLYPNASIDHYPFEARSLEPGSPAQKEMALRYAPASASGNLRSGRREQPVEDLIADGPGTLAPGASRHSQAKGRHRGDTWSVVLRRNLPEGLGPRQRTQIAFAIWEGSKGETGARKMRTGWISLLLQGAP